ncbi:MAG TPA: EMC3/TMCO1 family protein, partial [Candidatus Bathyarchaeia archaeon]|nr:EMC3/TMCO1 family protein [Candidatus Bathyarchaeia archaeon]
MSIIDDILNTLAAPLRPYSHPPDSTILVLGAAILLSVITMTANRFLVNYKMIANSRREYVAWTNAMRKAKKDGDDKALEKLMRRQSAVMKMYSRSTFEQFKTYPITIVPFLLIYYTVVRAVNSIPVAYAPFLLPFTTVTANNMFSVLSLFY